MGGVCYYNDSVGVGGGGDQISLLLFTIGCVGRCVGVF